MLARHTLRDEGTVFNAVAIAAYLYFHIHTHRSSFSFKFLRATCLGKLSSKRTPKATPLRSTRVFLEQLRIMLASGERESSTLIPPLRSGLPLPASSSGVFV